MKVLIACEESQTVCIEFRKLGHEAYSCDIQDCSGGHPEWHIKDDIKNVLYNDWDYIIAHPPCTRLCNSGVRWLHERDLWDDLNKSCEFFNLFSELGKKGKKVRIENPIPHKYAVNIIGKPSQIIQPWQFGEQKMKATCLWNYNVPDLRPTDIVGPPPKDINERNKWQDIWLCPPGKDRAKIRSKTYIGIAKALAYQATL